MGFLDLFRIGKIKSENEALKQKLQLLHADEYFQIREQLDAMTAEISSNNSVLSQQRNEISELSNQRQKLDKQVNTQKNKLSRCKELYQSVEYALNNFLVLSEASSATITKLNFPFFNSFRVVSSPDTTFPALIASPI